MSIASVRAELAAAMSTIDGITGYAEAPTVVRAGDAVVQLGPITRELYWQAEWQVTVVLGADQGAADELVSGLLAAVESATRPVAYLAGAEPVVIDSEAGDLIGLRLTFSREL